MIAGVRDRCHRRLRSVSGGDSERLTYAFRSCVARPPTAEEHKVLADLLAAQQQRIAEGWVNPREIATGLNELPADLPAGVTPAQLAAYTVVARVILNLDETITKE